MAPSTLSAIPLPKLLPGHSHALISTVFQMCLWHFIPAEGQPLGQPGLHSIDTPRDAVWKHLETNAWPRPGSSCGNGMADKVSGATGAVGGGRQERRLYVSGGDIRHAPGDPGGLREYSPSSFLPMPQEPPRDSRSRIQDFLATSRTF